MITRKAQYNMSEQLKVSPTSRSLLNDKWDVVLSNLVVKTGLGFGAGVVASVYYSSVAHSQFGSAWVSGSVGGMPKAMPFSVPLPV